MAASSASVATASRCTACGNSARALFTVGDLNRAVTDQAFTYHRCGACGLVFMHPLPANIAEHYPQAYYTPPNSLGRLDEIAAKQRYQIDLVRRFRDAGDLLEIGPAYGAFARLAQRAGYAVEVIELDPDCCRFMAEVVGLAVIQSGDPGAALAQVGEKDVIALWHVIEHLPDPWSFLEAAAGRLKGDGILLIAAPDPQALQFKIFGRRWVHLDAPRHLQLIPLEVLTRRLAGLGLQRELATRSDRGGLLWNVFGWRRSLGNLVSRHWARRLLEAAGLAASPALLAADLAFGGATYTAVFRKAAP